MQRRERLERAVAGQTVDRVPAIFWRHFPGDDQRSADFAHAVVQFQQQYDWDAVVVAPPCSYMTAPYGTLSEWSGALNGDRHIQKFAITRSLDWTELRPQDPYRSETGKVLETIDLVRKSFPAQEIPLLVAIYSPLTQARRLTTKDELFRHIRTQADRLRSGLNTITDNTLKLIGALSRASVDGIIYVTELADYTELSEAEYRVFGLPYDTKILTNLPDTWWFNLLDISAELPMFTVVQDYPVQAVRWKMQSNRPDIQQGKSLIRGAVCGGIPAADTIMLRSPSVVKDAAREAIRATNGRRIILSTNGTLPVATPSSNLRAARNATTIYTERA